MGARLQKDGRIPYFYKWKKADGYRYIDPENNNNFKVSNITASPVFHNLLLPICDLSQRSISFLWFCFQYLMLVIITVLFVKLSKNNIQKCIVINFSVLFTCTEAWKSLIAAGQLYLFIGLLIAFVVYGLLKSTKNQYLYFAAFSTALLVLIRPTALIIFIPFFIQYRYTYKYLLRSFAFMIAYGLFSIINQQELRLWVSYVNALNENVKAHQHLNPSLQINEPFPIIKNLEGLNISETDKFNLQNPIPIYSENGNIFDPWIKIHLKSGGKITNICTQSVHIKASLSKWREWTQLSFPQSGDYEIPQGLVPLSVDREKNLATYTEPNVWMRYRI